MNLVAGVLACATCYGDPSSSMTHGMNMAIVTMLSVTGVVLGGLGAALACFARRARRHAIDESV